MKRRLLIFSAAVGAAVLLMSTSAFADSCANVSRAPAPCGFSCDHVVTAGNWIWLPSLSNVGLTDLPPLWGFAPPGAEDSQLLNLPGAHGNYLNGYSSSLLGHSANCPPGSNTHRQTDHGVQTGCV